MVLTMACLTVLEMSRLCEYPPQRNTREALLPPWPWGNDSQMPGWAEAVSPGLTDKSARGRAEETGRDGPEGSYKRKIKRINMQILSR